MRSASKLIESLDMAQPTLSLCAKTSSAVPHPADGWCERDSARRRSAPLCRYRWCQPSSRPIRELMRKGPTYIGGFVGSFGGSFIPSLWGAGQLSMSSIVFFVIGGVVGIWIAYRLLV
jgi:hypothetical protein